MPSTLRVECLPARHGDCILVDYGPDAARHRLLIDAGPVTAYQDISRALSDHPSPSFDLGVVTHIDADHIDGWLVLLQDGSFRVDPGDFWFNGWPQLMSEHAPDVFSPVQGTLLESLREGQPWNVAFGGGPAVATEDHPLPRLPLPGNAEAILIAPSPVELRTLRRRWQKALRDAGLDPNDLDAARTRLAQRKEYLPPLPRQDVFAAKRFGDDTSVANASSIAFVFEHGGRRILFTGDAQVRPLAAGLRHLAGEDGAVRVQLDAMKVPHHGSMSNIDETIMSLIDCDRYLVSTDGSHFGHPDAETIELIGSRGNRPDVHFNYRCPTTERWATTQAQDRAGIRAFFPPDGAVLEFDVDPI